MKTLLVAIATFAVLTVAGGCASNVDPARPDDGPASGSSAPTPRADKPDVADSEACREVRIGIEAFNAGEFDETVAHFEKAVPLAEEQDDGSDPAGQLVEAVRYYAELDAELYPQASRSSPEFAKYKEITLGQCLSGAVEPTESPGVQV